MKILTLIPARSGSKGLPGKNIRDFNGRPLIQWVVRTATEFGQQERIICSTDSQEIAQCAREVGALVPIIRPKELAKDDTSILEVIKYVLRTEKDAGHNYTHVLLLQPTSPTVKPSDIRKAVDLVEKRSADTVITGYKVKGINPEKMYRQNSFGCVAPLEGFKSFEARRQDYVDVYTRTGLLYLVAVDVIATDKLYGKNVFSIEIEADRALTIDTLDDFLKAEKYFRELEKKMGWDLDEK